MEVKDAPPKTITPSAGSGGGDNLKVLILANCRVKDDDTMLPSLRLAFKSIGTPLLGGYVQRARCMCGEGCKEMTIFGLVLPRSEEAMVNIGLFFHSVQGEEIKDTNDPDLQPGKFSEHLE